MTNNNSKAADACAVTLLYKIGRLNHGDASRRLRALGLPDFVRGGVSPLDELMKAPTIRYMKTVAPNYAK